MGTKKLSNCQYHFLHLPWSLDMFLLARMQRGKLYAPTTPCAISGWRFVRAIVESALTGTNGSFKNIKLVWLTAFRLVQMAGTGACHYAEKEVWQIQPFCGEKIQASCDCLVQIRESKTVATCLWPSLENLWKKETCQTCTEQFINRIGHF